jgi:hypothetical protein
MEKVYYLDLATLVEYLQEQSTTLCTQVKVPGVREACTGYIWLKEGRITNCFVQAQDGQLLHEGERAYALLHTSKQWQIRLEKNSERAFKTGTTQQIPALGSHPPPVPLAAPRQKQVLEPYLLEGFSMKQRLVLRTVLAMINGERTVDQIKAHLHLPPEIVEQALEHLRFMGIIE